MQVFIARQPIFDKNQRVNAYEILYRDGTSNGFGNVDGDEASRNVIFNTFHTFGIENLTNGKPAFINFTENLINDETATLFPKDFLVVEILEDVLPSGMIIAKSRLLKELGYSIALDDFVYNPQYEGLIDLADIIKIDFLMSSREEIEDLTTLLRERDKILLAEKVETRSDFEYAANLGFTLFQGYFFSKPEILNSKKIQPIRTTCLQLVSEANKEELDFSKISKIISMDLALTYNLLKLVNSAAFGFRYEIESVKHAVAALGEREMRKWIYLVIVNTIGEDEPDELIRLSLIRARFAELIALNTRFRKDSEDLFLIGLFSLLDVILKRPIDMVLDELRTTKTIKTTLIHGRGESGLIYKMILAYEKGEWDEFGALADGLRIHRNIVSAAYMEALLWYNMLLH